MEEENGIGMERRGPWNGKKRTLEWNEEDIGMERRGPWNGKKRTLECK